MDVNNHFISHKSFSILAFIQIIPPVVKVWYWEGPHKWNSLGARASLYIIRHWIYIASEKLN
jgi:hypothetical protein